MTRWILPGVLVTLSCYLLPPSAVFAQFGPPPSETRTRPVQLPLSGSTQTGSVTTGQATVPSASSQSVSTLNSSIQIQGPFQGSTPVGVLTNEPLPLSIDEAIRLASYKQEKDVLKKAKRIISSSEKNREPMSQHP